MLHGDKKVPDDKKKEDDFEYKGISCKQWFADLEMTRNKVIPLAAALNLLGLSEESAVLDVRTSEEDRKKTVRKAFTDLSREWHPDKHPEDIARYGAIFNLLKKSEEYLIQFIESNRDVKGVKYFLKSAAFLQLSKPDKDRFMQAFIKLEESDRREILLQQATLCRDKTLGMCNLCDIYAHLNLYKNIDSISITKKNLLHQINLVIQGTERQSRDALLNGLDRASDEKLDTCIRDFQGAACKVLMEKTQGSYDEFSLAAKKFTKDIAQHFADEKLKNGATQDSLFTSSRSEYALCKFIGTVSGAVLAGRDFIFGSVDIQTFLDEHPQMPQPACDVAIKVFSFLRPKRNIPPIKPNSFSPALGEVDKMHSFLVERVEEQVPEFKRLSPAS